MVPEDGLLRRELLEQHIIFPHSNNVPMGTDVDKSSFDAYGDLKVNDRFSHRKVAPLSFSISRTPMDTSPPEYQLHQVVYCGRIQRILRGLWIAQMLIRSSATFGILYKGLASRDLGEGCTRFCLASPSHFCPWTLERESIGIRCAL